MASRDDTAVARAILASAFMLSITALGVIWALMVDAPGILALVVVVDAIIAFFAYAGLISSRPSQASPKGSDRGIQV